MRLLATALIAATMLSLPALAQDTGGSSSRMDQDMRYLETAGEMTPDPRATIAMTPYTPTMTIQTQTSQLPQPMPIDPEPAPLASR